MDLVLQINEDDFISACVRGEEWAQKKLYEDHYNLMYPTCLRYANDEEEALDILHEGFIKIFKNISKYQSGTSLKAWIKRVMVNTAIDHYRKKARKRTESLESAYGVANLDIDAVSMMSADEILLALQELTPAYRSVFNLYVIEGFPHKEVAVMLGITESTSRSNLVKARNKLKKNTFEQRNQYGRMKERFDDIIRKKLTEINAQPKAMSWDDFKEKMSSDANLESPKDKQLDREIKSKLADYHMNFNPRHWTMLQLRLRKQARNLENLYVSKAFEFITIILLLLIFAQNGFYVKAKSSQVTLPVATAQLDPQETKNTSSYNTDYQEVMPERAESSPAYASNHLPASDRTIKSNQSTHLSSEKSLENPSIREAFVRGSADADIPLNLYKNSRVSEDHIIELEHVLNTLETVDLAALEPGANGRFYPRSA